MELSTYLSKEDKAELAQDIREVPSPDDKRNTKEQAHQALIDLSEKRKTRIK